MHRPRPLLFLSLLLLTAGLVSAWWHTSAATRALDRRRTALAHRLAALQSRLDARSTPPGVSVLPADTPQLASPPASPSTAGAAPQSANVDRARLQAVFDRIRAARAHRASVTPSRPPPPRGPAGLVFPELWDDSEYRRCHTFLVRCQQSGIHGPLLRELAVPPAPAERVLDLLTERALLPLEFRRLLGAAVSITSDHPAVRAERTRIDADICTVLGADLYARFSTDIVEFTRTVDASGAAAEHRTTRRGVPEDRRVDRDYASSLAAPLERRLSYGPEPLTDTQVQQLHALFAANQARPPEQHYPANPWNDSRFLRDISPLLTPPQRTGLSGLRVEAEAHARRVELGRAARRSRAIASTLSLID